MEEKIEMVEEQPTEKIVKERNLNESIIKIRVELQNSKLKKSGKNKFAGFDYFELADFLPRLNELMLEENVNDLFNIKDNEATLTLIKGKEKQIYSIPFTMFETPINMRYDNNTKKYKEVKSMQDIQYLGALNTYYKRYLYLNAFGITDGEVIDSMDNSNLEKSKIDELKEKIKKYGVKASARLKEIGKKIRELNEEELNLLLEELESEK